jgi:DNA-binding CsgD family transcriptional regulator
MNRWGDPLVRAEMSPAQARVLAAAREFQLRHGYVVPVHASGAVPAAFFYAAPHGDIAAGAYAFAERLSIVIHEYACRLARERMLGARPAPALSPRERACLELYANGLDDQAAAARLGLAVATIRRHHDGAKKRLGAARRVQAVARAIVSRQIDIR